MLWTERQKEARRVPKSPQKPLTHLRTSTKPLEGLGAGAASESEGREGESFTVDHAGSTAGLVLAGRSSRSCRRWRGRRSGGIGGVDEAEVERRQEEERIEGVEDEEHAEWVGEEGKGYERRCQRRETKKRERESSFS